MIALLLLWGRPWHAGVVGALLLVQAQLMMRYLREPRGLAPWYNGTGTTLYVLGMLVTALAIAGVPSIAVMRDDPRPLTWLGIMRLGLVQAALGAVVVLTTSTLNRVMVVEYGLPAAPARRARRIALRRPVPAAALRPRLRRRAARARRGSSAGWRCLQSAALPRRRRRR